MLRRGHLVWRALVSGQITNQLQNDRHILQARRTNLEFGTSLHSYFSGSPVHDGSDPVPRRTFPCPRPFRYENSQAFRKNDLELPRCGILYAAALGNHQCCHLTIARMRSCPNLSKLQKGQIPCKRKSRSNLRSASTIRRAFSRSRFKCLNTAT